LDGTLETVTVAEAPILEFEIALDCLMLGRSLLGQQVHDVLAAGRYLARIRPDVAGSLTLAACGPLSSLRALFAAALEPAIGAVSLDGLPLSWASIVHAEPGPLGPTAYVFDVLRHFDLGDVLALLAGRTVTLRRTVDGSGRGHGAAGRASRVSRGSASIRAGRRGARHPRSGARGGRLSLMASSGRVGVPDDLGDPRKCVGPRVLQVLGHGLPGALRIAGGDGVDDALMLAEAVRASTLERGDSRSGR
jgi:hypothetical protein